MKNKSTIVYVDVKVSTSTHEVAWYEFRNKQGTKTHQTLDAGICTHEDFRTITDCADKVEQKNL